MFLATSVHYRAVLREFDTQDGLRRVLNILRALVAQLRWERCSKTFLKGCKQYRD